MYHSRVSLLRVSHTLTIYGTVGLMFNDSVANMGHLQDCHVFAIVPQTSAIYSAVTFCVCGAN